MENIHNDFKVQRVKDFNTLHFNISRHILHTFHCIFPVVLEDLFDNSREIFLVSHQFS